MISVLEKGEQFDIYCLDILMPGYTGLEAAKEIRRFDKNAQIIFVTGSPEFALESYCVKAINYVLKPVTREKIFLTLDEAIDCFEIQAESYIVIKGGRGIDLT